MIFWCVCVYRVGKTLVQYRVGKTFKVKPLEGVMIFFCFFPCVFLHEPCENTFS